MSLAIGQAALLERDKEAAERVYRASYTLALGGAKRRTARARARAGAKGSSSGKCEAGALQTGRPPTSAIRASERTQSGEG